MTPTVKQSAPDELPTSDKSNFTTKNKCILNIVQQASNKIPIERTKSRKRQSKKFQGAQVQESTARKFELTSLPQRTTGQRKYIFYGNILLFPKVLHLPSFLQLKLFINFLSIGFQTMSLKRTMGYSILLISFITSISFSNLSLAYKNIDESPVDTGLKWGVYETFRRCHGCLFNASCTLHLHPVTTENCHHFYYKNFTIAVLELNNFGHNLSIYGEMAATVYMKIDQNYNKYIFNQSISQNLQPIRNNENDVKYYWIIFTVSLLFLYKQLYNRRSKVLLFVIVSLIQFTIAFHTLSVVCRSKPSLTQISESLQQRNFSQLKFYISLAKLMNFRQICTSNYSLLAT